MSSSPAGLDADIVGDRIVLPVVRTFPHFEVKTWDFTMEPGSISQQIITEFATADLVVADLTELSPGGYYELAVRHAMNMPTVCMSDQEYVVPIDARDFLYLRYSIHSEEEINTARTNLALLIHQALIADRGARGSSPWLLQRDGGSPRQRQTELAERISGAADALRQLQLNSTSDAIGELEAIARELRAVSEEAPPDLREFAQRALRVLLTLLEQLGTVPAARIIISGAAGLFVGGAGASGVVAFGLAMSAWFGKDAFKAALDKWTPKS